MFKRTEEAEWSRFSKALSNKEKETAQREDEVVSEDEQSHDSVNPASMATASPSTPRAQQDVNVTVSRASSRQLPSAPPAADNESLIADQTFIDGTLRAEESIHIRGAIQGEVESKRHVFIEEQAKVTAKVTGESVTVAGQVNGQIFCAGRVEIKPTGRVVGEITAGTLIMQEGAFFEGNLKMASRDQQGRAAAAAS
jgi:cytoskeletal protein CcmA (bactofilin family)